MHLFTLAYSFGYFMFTSPLPPSEDVTEQPLNQTVSGEFIFMFCVLAITNVHYKPTSVGYDNIAIIILPQYMY